MTYSILRRLNAVPLTGSLHSLFSVFSYTNHCLNPFIYATQFEVVKNWWKKMMWRLVCGWKVQETSMTMSGRPESKPTPENAKNTKNFG